MSLKHVIRGGLDSLARVMGLLARYESSMQDGITVLMYHRILDDEAALHYPLASLAMPVSWFRMHVQWLAEHAHVNTMADAFGGEAPAPPQGKPVVCISFDDGYSDNYESAAPILEECGLRGTFFVTAGNIANRTPLWFDQAFQLYELLGADVVSRPSEQLQGENSGEAKTLHDWMESLKDMPNDRRLEILDELNGESHQGDNETGCQLMTMEQVKDLARRGHEIGSHSLSHPILPQLDEDAIVEEVGLSRTVLQCATDSSVAGFCYPNGDYDRRVVNAVREAGYTYACSTRPGRNHEREDRFYLKRIDMTPSRVGRASGTSDMVGFRSELCLLRERMRGRAGS